MVTDHQGPDWAQALAREVGARHEEALATARAMTEIKTRLDIFVDEFRHEREAAALHRKDLRVVVGALGEAVRTVSSKLGEVAPIVASHQTLQSEARGMARAGYLIWVAGVAASGLVGAWVGKLLRGE